MELNLEQFLLMERLRLQTERVRLSARSDESHVDGVNKDEVLQNNVKECAALEFINNASHQQITCNRRQQNYNSEFNTVNDPLNSSETYTTTTANTATTTTSSHATMPSSNHESTKLPTPQANITTADFQTTFALFAKFAPEKENENASSTTIHMFNRGLNDGVEDTNLQWTKSAKDWANIAATSEACIANEVRIPIAPVTVVKEKLKNKDDMEQWVSDTFYSYFPGYNNENQKRQNLLRERQHEYQQNFLKHQMSHPPLSKNAAQKAKIAQQNLNLNTARSSSSTTSHATDKTDLEIIVNNPNYVPPKQQTTASTRPDSTRHKLLQDLRHTELAHMMNGDAAMERNRSTAELETARKKDYQRELMLQIEEKRRSIETLREKERRQEETLTRRLQEQLKTIHLEEQLEKEKLRAEKIRFDTEQNRLRREQLLAKLENDTKLLYANNSNINNTISKNNLKVKNETNKENNATPMDTAKSSKPSDDNNGNKVYKYFSNSARHEYRRGKPMPPDIELDLDIAILDVPENTERECFHLSDKVCPMCDGPLKTYENCCLRCQRKLSLKLSEQRKPPEVHEKSEEKSNRTINSQNDSKSSSEDAAVADDEATVNENDAHSYSLVCVKCERLYTMCPTCLAKSDVCRACHRKRNVCMSCRRTLCSFCLEEIACGKDTERRHRNDDDSKLSQKNHADSPRSFQVLDVHFAPHKETDESGNISSSPPATMRQYTKAKLSYKHIPNNLYDDAEQSPRPPYSINIERNSIFHPDFATAKQTASFEQLPKVMDKHLSFDLQLDSASDERQSMERVRKETDKRLSRYLKNYGDLAQSHSQRSKSELRNRSTQTTPDSANRRDIVLNGAYNLSMPLLREMPKMTRKDHSNLLEMATNNQRKIDNLKRRWEIPAVQKNSISPTAPHIITQVGAIRRQLQAERILADNNDNIDHY